MKGNNGCSASSTDKGLSYGVQPNGLLRSIGKWGEEFNISEMRTRLSGIWLEAQDLGREREDNADTGDAIA